MNETMNIHSNMEINYDALANMVETMEATGVFSLDSVREVFGPVVDEAIQAEVDARL